MDKNILIVHYNTPYLTECLVRSINLFVKDAKIFIFDNSTEKPFTAKFDNVTIFNNTKGQIINFDKWLNNYPNRKMSGGSRNYWGSAKHCVSVEKCMELIDGNFILMDSDILLKKDCSDLYQDDCIYVGQVQNQPSSKIDRVLPFICFINNKMCKKHNIHYFDDNYMHGLRKTPKGDMYDTGAVLCKDSIGLKHRDISVSDYIVHYNNASWMSTTTKKHTRTVDEWLRIHKKLYSAEKNKKVVYTCIIGGYDSLSEPKYITDGFDYICFTDDKSLKSDIWEIRPLPKETENLSQVKKQRYVKINPHLFLKEYDLSIWVDGNVVLKGDLNKFVKKYINDKSSIYVPKHPQRNCIYLESTVVGRMGKDKKEVMKPQMDRYKKEGFPQNYGLLQSNILLRKHNNEDCIKLMEEWFNEVKKGSHRDQLSFNYVSWKNKEINIVYMDSHIYKSEFFYWSGTHNHNKSYTRYDEDNIDMMEWDGAMSKSNTVQPKVRKSIEHLKTEFHNLLNKRIKTYNVAIY